MTATNVFPTTFHGDVLQPSAPGYDAARKVWNGMIDRRPAFIARCKSVSDVQTALRFANQNGLVTAIRGGGHNAAGLGVCDDGVVIDLGGLRDVLIDPARSIARAGGGTTWGEFDRATAGFGFATTGGAVSTTGIAGLTLGGGLGWLMRSYGLACDNLVGVEMVTADSRVVRASESENADLFWALRGGGGNFGVVTSFEFKLHPVSTVFGGMLIYPLSKARDLLRVYRDVTRNASDKLTVFAAMMHAPDGTPVVAFVLCYNGPADEGERAISAIRTFATPVAGDVGPMPYPALQGMLDAGFPSGLHVHWRSEFMNTVSDTFIEAAVSAFEKVPSPLSAMMLEHFGGEVSRVPRDATAFDQRDSEYNLVIVSRWADHAEREKNVAWARETSDMAAGFTTGRVYLNYIGAGEAPERVRDAFGPEKFARLSSIKKKYDPSNMFRMNQNIPPAP
ncbi:MAG TPA: FAD-binding oxidoreductase [Gemmatimonadaceae bacterium]|jgi:FAD/FMN-containing dehydrogenase